MKFIVSSAVLLKNLQAISGVLISSSALPILEYFLFELEGNELRVTATDLETTMTVAISLSMTEEEGVIAVPAKILLETLKTLPDVPLSFSANVDGDYMIELVAGEGKFRLAGQDGIDFPKAPALLDVSSITVDSV